MCKRLSLCFALVGLSIATTAKAGLAQFNADESAYSCHVRHIPTSFAFHPAPGTIQSSNASISGAGEASFDLSFRNSESIAISSLTLVVEYIANENDVIDRVAMSAHVQSAAANVPSYVFRPARQWTASLPRGGTATLVGEDYGIWTARCPVRARITFARVQFTDHSIRNYSSPEWRLDPRPVMVPNFRDGIPELPVEAPVSLLANLKISASGEVLDVIPEELTEAVLIAWLRDRMKHGWKFHPGLVNGKPTESNLDVLFLMHAKGMQQFSGSEPTPQPVTVIRFMWTWDRFPGADVLEQFTVMYGLLDEGAVPDFSIPGIRTLPPDPYWDGVVDDSVPDDL